MKPTVYIDTLFLINFLMDTITLKASALLLKRDIHILRLAAAAAFSALYSSLIFFPVLTLLYSFFGKAIFLFLTIMIAFPEKKALPIIKNTLTFYAVNAVFGGIIFALIFATDFGTTLGAVVSNGEIYLETDFLFTALSTAISYAVIFVCGKHCKKRSDLDNLIHKISITFGEKNITVNALADTGCSLCSVSGSLPAVIIGDKYAKELNIPDFSKEENHNGEEYQKRYRPLIYSTIDNKCSIMHGFIPDSILLDGEREVRAVIGVSDAPICENPQFCAIFNPEILKQTRRLSN